VLGESAPVRRHPASAYRSNFCSQGFYFGFFFSGTGRERDNGGMLPAAHRRLDRCETDLYNL